LGAGQGRPQQVEASTLQQLAVLLLEVAKAKAVPMPKVMAAPITSILFFIIK